LGALGIGRKKMIEDWLEEQQIYAYHIINDDYSIDITEYGVDIRSIGLNVFPDYIQFNKINGFFNCCHNNLTSLRGCPIYYVKGDFLCSSNKLRSLDFCPKYVGENFYCGYNITKFTQKDVENVCDVVKRIFTH
jgi:hypothetical protein